MTNRLSFEDLVVGYGHRVVLDGLSGEIVSGRWIHLWGENGTGKSSLLRVLASLQGYRSGRVTWNGVLLEEQREEYRRSIRYFGHEEPLFGRLTVSQNWNLYGDLMGLDGTVTSRFTESVPGDRPVDELSQGQRQRVGLATLMAAPRQAVFLDEPLASLDEGARENLVDHLLEICSMGGMVLSASPRPLEGPDGFWHLVDGRLRWEG